jgi:nucleoporin NDC1
VVSNTPVVRKAVFKNTPSSPLHSVVESLAADGAVTQALTHTLDSTVAHLPDLFKSTGPPAQVAAVEKTVASVKVAKPNLLEKIQIPTGFIPQRTLLVARQVGQWWSRPRASRVADGVVPNRETDILIAEGWQV